MLGSINTGGFKKSQVDAMRDSNYFNRRGVAGIYDPINRSAPVITGSPRSGNFLTNFISDMPQLGRDDEGKSFLDRFQSYRPKEKSGQDEFYGELAKRMGSGSGGYAAPVAEGLTYMRDEQQAPTVIGGTPGQPGLLQTVGVPLLGAFLCDIRTKEDIAPLCNSEVNDVLSDCAYFVKDLNECS